MKKTVRIFLVSILLLTIVSYLSPVYALSSTGKHSYTDPEGDMYTDYVTDDGYLDMRDLTGLSLEWDSNTLTISITVKDLTNTTAAWNNTGFTITISNGTGGTEWLPQWSSTHFDTTTAEEALWEYCILIQNITAEDGLKYCYVVDSGYNYEPFATHGVEVEFPEANNVTVHVPWDAIGGFSSYGDEFYVCAFSFYCYAYGTASTGDLLTKYLDHMSPSNSRTVNPHPDWGNDPEGYPKYEVIIGDCYVVPEFMIVVLLVALIAFSVAMVAIRRKLAKR